MKIELFISSFEEILDNIEGIDLLPSTNFKELDDWDSLTALSLIAIVDEVYGFKLNGDQIRESNTIEDLFLLVNGKNF